MYETGPNGGASEGDDTVLHRSEGDSSMGVVEKTQKRIHEVLTVYEGASLALLHTSVRAYNHEWKAVFEQMIKDGDVRVVAVKFRNTTHLRHYTNKPAGSVEVLGEVSIKAIPV